MKIGDRILFVINFENSIYDIICECWNGFEGVTYGDTVYKDGQEIFHAGYGKKIETYQEAETFLREVLQIRDIIDEKRL